MKTDASRPHRVLVFRIGHLGDTLVAIPAIRAIERRHAGANKVLVTERRPNVVSAWDVLEPLKIFQNALFYDPTAGFMRKAVHVTRLVLRLRQMRFEYAYNLSPERSWFQYWRDFFFFRRVVGARTYVSLPLVPGRVKARAAGLRRREPEWRRLLNVIAPEAVFAGELMPVGDEDKIRAKECLEALHQSHARLVALGPGSKMPAKMWPKERFLELGRRLLERYPDTALVVLGGRSDHELGDWLCRHWNGRALNLAGKLSIYESAAVLRHCVSYVGNDTGVMHLAALSRVPCVAIFSARDYPGMWEPMGSNHIVLRAEIECQGCMLEECTAKNNECLQRISTGEAFAGICAILDQGTPRHA